MNKTNNNLYDDIYIIDHDYLGASLEKPITLTSKDNKVNYKDNHPTFKCNVIYYTTTKTSKIEVYYDAQTHVLLGYKEENKQVVENKINKRKIKIQYSVFNKLKLMGMRNTQTDLLSYYKDYMKEYILDITNNYNDNVKQNLMISCSESKKNQETILIDEVKIETVNTFVLSFLEGGKYINIYS